MIFCFFPFESSLSVSITLHPAPSTSLTRSLYPSLSHLHPSALNGVRGALPWVCFPPSGLGILSFWEHRTTVLLEMVWNYWTSSTSPLVFLPFFLNVYLISLSSCSIFWVITNFSSNLSIGFFILYIMF